MHPTSIHLPRRVANVYFNLQRYKKKQHQAASSIGFIRKCLHLNVTPKFATVKGQFTSKAAKIKTERDIMTSHLEQHTEKLNVCIESTRALMNDLQLVCGQLLTKLLVKRIDNNQRRFRVLSSRTKNDKIRRLVIDKVVQTERVKSSLSRNKGHQKTKQLSGKYQSKIINNQPVPIINLSDLTLSKSEEEILSYGLEHSFIDKNKNVKKNLAASLETTADRITYMVDDMKKEDLHEYLRANVDIMTKNVYSSADSTFNRLKNLIRDKNIAVIQGDKDSCVVVMNKTDYLQKLQQMIEEGIADGTYERTCNTVLSDMKKFNDFLYRHFKKTRPELYEEMTASAGQPGQLYGSAKTHKFDSVSDISVDSLKFRPIISQVGTFTHAAAQVIGNYLKPLVDDNEYIINNTQDFAAIISDQPPLGPTEEYVSYDVESLFTNVPVMETIDYILDEIYVKKKLPHLCKRSLFKKLLLKLTCDGIFMFNDKFYKQKNGCTMGGPLSVILSNIFMTKLERKVVLPVKPAFYKRYVDDIITRRKKNQPDKLLSRLMNFHPKIKFTVEVNPEKFLDTRLIFKHDGVCETRVFRKPNKVPLHWHSKTPVRYKRNAIIGDLTRAKRISGCFTDEVEIIRTKFLTAGFPKAFVDSVIRNFLNPQQDKDDSLPLIPSFFFEETQPFILIELPYCPQNERLSKHFIRKIKSFLEVDCTIVIKWITRKIRTLFSLKSKNPHPACKIYQGVCNGCGQSYVGETKRNVEVRWAEHENPKGNSEPAKHLANNPSHSFSWRVLLNASQNTRVRKNLEASVVAYLRPKLNNQIESKKLTLFRHGVT